MMILSNKVLFALIATLAPNIFGSSAAIITPSTPTTRSVGKAENVGEAIAPREDFTVVPIYSDAGPAHPTMESCHRLLTLLRSSPQNIVQLDVANWRVCDTLPQRTAESCCVGWGNGKVSGNEVRFEALVPIVENVIISQVVIDTRYTGGYIDNYPLTKDKRTRVCVEQSASPFGCWYLRAE